MVSKTSPLQAVVPASKCQDRVETETFIGVFFVCCVSCLTVNSYESDTQKSQHLWTVPHTHLRSSVQFSHSVVSDSLRPHKSQHTRPPCPSPTPGVHSNSCPSSRWCHPAISSSVVPFSACPQSLPASGSFPVSQFFAWGGQSIGVSALASFLSKSQTISFQASDIL